MKSWDHSPDYRTWTYHLREDVTWHKMATGEYIEDVKSLLHLFTAPLCQRIYHITLRIDKTLKDSF